MYGDFYAKQMFYALETLFIILKLEDYYFFKN